ncbi:MAG: hypothetical protein KAY37_10260 [Phycisphaerae bacterium]|nr:hypothetical protein [Phycisphaerae bacterium]
MQTHATVTIAYHGIELRCPSAGVSEDRPFTAGDVALLQSWAARYQELARDDRPAAGLLQLGEDVFTWLNGPERFLVRLLDTAQPPLLIEFAAGREDTPRARAFLDAPWELLASDGRHWALRADAIYCPIRAQTAEIGDVAWTSASEMVGFSARENRSRLIRDAARVRYYPHVQPRPLSIGSCR